MTGTAEVSNERRTVAALAALVALVTLVALVAGLATARPAAGQDGTVGTRFQITADAGVSVRDSFDGVRLARDMVTYGLRLTAVRRDAFDPWLEGARFTRPALDCISGLPCTDAGWLLRAGLALPLSRDDEPGLHPAVRAGLGAAVADETSLSYLFGFGLYWRRIPRLEPMLEARWEHIVGINIALLAAGVRIAF